MQMLYIADTTQKSNISNLRYHNSLSLSKIDFVLDFSFRRIFILDKLFNHQKLQQFVHWHIEDCQSFNSFEKANDKLAF